MKKQHFHPETPNLALLTHGTAGHKNYLYMPLLAQKLSKENGWYSFRFDFRQSGDSYDPNNGTSMDENLKIIQTLEDDLVDLDVVCKFWNSWDNYRHFLFAPTTKLYLAAIIGHSRGALIMFRWSILQWRKHKEKDSSAILIRSLVNLLGRIIAKNIEDWSKRHIPDYPNAKTGLKLPCYKFGERTMMLSTLRETEMLKVAEYTGLYDLEQLNTSGYYRCLTVFGTDDRVVPVTDAAEAVNRLCRISRLALVPGAGHNYLGHVKVTPENALIVNPKNYPVNSRGVVNYAGVVSDHVCSYLGDDTMRVERYKSASTASVSRSQRWKDVEGVCNFRDLGGYEVVDFELLNSNQSVEVRPNYAFRCADTSQITEKGLQTLSRLGITTVFDLRSDSEVLDRPFPVKLCDSVTGGTIQYKHIPMFPKTNLGPGEIFLRYQRLISSPYAIPDVYLDFLKLGSTCIRHVFSHILQDKGPFVFHCSAGKDRTGVISLLLLKLCGVSSEDIASDYELTSLGIQPLIPTLRQTYEIQMERYLASYAEKNYLDIQDKSGVVKHLNAYLWGEHGTSDLYKEGFENLISLNFDTMLITLSKFDETFGDVHTYFENVLGFSKDEVIRIKKTLVGDYIKSIL